jgi:hypothetical protein
MAAGGNEQRPAKDLDVRFNPGRGFLQEPGRQRFADRLAGVDIIQGQDLGGPVEVDSAPIELVLDVSGPVDMLRAYGV